ncbi:uncharacterized protein LOC141692444 isoform X3 [Apium graveolens]|uniref:uncharacterized protein LOC141692444 isoform X3 n=1 Tax=Apium graveolens TaxID=4045 RepID=UPI003D78F0D6
MWNSMNPQNETLTNPFTNNFDNNQLQIQINESQSQQWEETARAWLSTLPEGKIISSDEIEAWIQSNEAYLPDHIKNMPRPDLHQLLASIYSTITRSPEVLQDDHSQGDHSQARFQRTDQWKPVYTWLETLEDKELVKSNDIADWLSANPDVRDDLYSRHSRYHLMHYIKKLHVKILKRKERKKGFPITKKANTKIMSKSEGKRFPVPLPCSTTVINLPPDSDLYKAKRSEALHKYEILLDLEKQLSALYPKPQLLNK